MSVDYLRGDPAEIIAADDDSVRSDFLERIRRAQPRWHRDAACSGTPLGWWFPGRGDSTSEAKRLCSTCPVRAECLAEALADPELDHGVRAGMTAPERRRMRREVA